MDCRTWFLERWVEPQNAFVVFDRNGRVYTADKYEEFVYAEIDGCGAITNPSQSPFTMYSSSRYLYDTILVCRKRALNIIGYELRRYLDRLQRRRELVVCVVQTPVHCVVRLIFEFL